ncbi:gamma carbonic anhydrase family protein [bacterium]|nr:gamma carbonic anhydrase family protein [bacterium]
MGKPDIDSSAFVATGACVIGNVTLRANASVWYNAVLRGDLNRIVIGESSNLQDGVIVHLENERGCTVGDYVTVGHGAILHGCTIEDGVLIGMGAVILNGVVIGRGSVIGAGAIVTEGSQIPPFSMVVGVPGKIVKSLPSETLDVHISWAKKYIQLAREHQKIISLSQ